MIVNALILIAATLLSVSNITPQQKSGDKPCRAIAAEPQVGSSDTGLPYCSPSGPQGYEINRVYVEDAADRAKKTDGSYVIVIARLGTGERPLHNRIRLKEIRTYLEEVLKARAVIAEAGRVKGLGRLEIYIAGKQLYVLPVKRSATLGLLELSP